MSSRSNRTWGTRWLLPAALLLPLPLAHAEPSSLPPCKISVRGAPDRAIRRDVLTISDTWTQRKNPPPSLRLLRRRVQRDADQMRLVMRTHGYYSATVQAYVRPGRKRTHVRFEVRAGPLYRIEGVHIQPVAPLNVPLPSPDDLGLSLRRPAEARVILLAEQELVRRLQSRGYPLARVTRRAVEADHATRGIRLAFRVEPGPAAVFGATLITGLQHLRQGFVDRAVPWKPGERFSLEPLDQLRTRLIRAGLFSAITVTPEGPPDEQGCQTIRVELRERRRRTVELGVGYTTDRGAGARAAWTHRNLFGGAERLMWSAEVSEHAASGEASFTRPHFLGIDQDLQLDVKAEREESDAYISQRLTTSALVEHYLSETWQISGGLSLRLSEVEQNGTNDEYLLVSAPLQLRRDSSDDLFDPHRGGRMLLHVEPVYDLLGGHIGFVRNRVVLTRYLRLSRRPFLVAAARAAVGALAGSSRNDVPADERLYAGGGGSIRGYAYQKVGPMDEEGHVLGGRSLIETSLELRWRMSESMGWAVFADGGSVHEEAWPDFGDSLQWGAGLGWRYFSPVGLVRVDVGVPVNRRKDLDDPYQLYVSIGQAF